MADEFTALIQTKLDTSEVEAKLQKLRNQDPIKIKVQFEGGDPGEKLKKQIETGLKNAKIDTSSITRQLSESFNFSNNTQVKGQVRRMVDTITAEMARGFDGAKIDPSQLTDKFFESYANLQNVLAESAAKQKSPFAGLYEDFYNQYKNTIVKITEETRSGLGSMWENISQSGRVAIGKGTDLDSVFSEIRDKYAHLFDDMSNRQGFNLDNQKDQILAFIQLLDQAKAEINKTLTLDDLPATTAQQYMSEAGQAVSSMVTNLRSQLTEAIAAEQGNIGEQFKIDLHVNQESLTSEIRSIIETTATEPLQIQLNQAEITSKLKEAIQGVSGEENPINLTVDINDIKQKIAEQLKTSDLPIEVDFRIDAEAIRSQLQAAIAGIDVQCDMRVNVKNNVAQEVQTQTAGTEVNIPVDVDTPSLEQLLSTLSQVNTVGRTGTSVFEKFGITMKQAFSYYTLANLLQQAILRVTNSAKEMVETVKDINTAMTNVQMVTNAPDDEIESLRRSYNSLGQEIGAITTDVAVAGEAWLRTGKSIKDTSKLVEDTMIFSKISGSSVADSQSYLVSAMNGYGVAVDDVIGIVDKFNAVDAAAAVSAAGLAEAMSKTANMAKQLGIDMDTLVGYIATISEITQASPPSIGTSLKSTLGRMSAIKSGKLQYMDPETGIEETVSDVETVLGRVGIQLRDSASEFREFDDVLQEIASHYNSWSTVTQTAVANALGGTRMQEHVRVLLSNYERVMELANVSANSEGSAEQKYSYYLESLQKKTDSLKASMESLAMNIIPEDAYAGVLDFGKALIDLVDNTNLLQGAMAALGTAGGIALFGKLTGWVSGAAHELSNLNSAMTMLKSVNIGKSLGSDEFAKLITMTGNLSKSQLALVASSTALSDAQKVALYMNTGLSQSEAEASVAALGLASAEGTATGATFSLSGALSGLWTVLMANPLILISAGIGIAVSAWTSYKRSLEQAVSAARDAGKVWSDGNADLQSQIDKVEELRAALTDSNTSETEAAEIRSQLLEIQGTLIDTYGSEAEGLDLVNGSLENQIALLNDLTEAEANRTLHENKKGFGEAVKQITSQRTQTVGRYMSNTDAGIALSGVLKNEKYRDNFRQVSDIMNPEVVELTFTGNAKEQSELINDLMTDLDRIEAEYGDGVLYDNYTDDLLSQANSVLDEYEEVYEEYQKLQIYASDQKFTSAVLGKSQTAKDFLHDYTIAIKEYNDALSSGDDTAIAVAAEKFDLVDTAIQELLRNEDLVAFEDLFANVGNQLDAASAKLYDYKKELNDNDYYKRITATLKDSGMSTDDFNGIFNFTENASEMPEEWQGYNTEAVFDMVSIAQQLGMIADTSEESIVSLGASLLSLGILTASTANDIGNAGTQIGDTFTSILGDTEDGNLSEKVDKFQDDMGAIQDALHSLNNGEDVNLADLIQQFPQLAGQTDNLQEALNSLKIEKLDEFMAHWKALLSGLEDDESIEQARDFLGKIVGEMELSGFGFRDVKNTLLDAFVPNSNDRRKVSGVWNKVFSEVVENQQDEEILLKVLADPSNAYLTVEGLIAKFNQEKAQVVVDVVANSETLISQINSLTDILNANDTGRSIDFTIFDADELKEYQSAIEHINGSIQLNEDKVRGLIKAKTEEQIAANDSAKAQKQQEYMRNASAIEKLQRELSGLTKGTDAYNNKLSEMMRLQDNNNAIISQCEQIDLYTQSLREATGAYAEWLNAQKQGSTGDMAKDVRSAMQNINDVWDSESDQYQRFGENRYTAAVDFIVPDSVSEQGAEAVKSYIDDLGTYFTGDKVGTDKFIQESIDQGLMDYDPDTGNVQIAANKTMEEFADAFNWTYEDVQAMFGDLMTYYGKDAFSWADTDLTLEDLGVKAAQAADYLRGLDSDIKVRLDVSDIGDAEGQVEVLETTITDMQDYKATLSVDSEEYQAANDIIAYCMAQIQQIQTPAIMSIDTTQIEDVDTDLVNALSLLQQFQSAKDTLTMQASVGMDTSEAQSSVDDLVSSIQALSPEVQGQLNIDASSAESIAESIKNITPEVLVDLGINEDAITEYAPDDKSAEVVYNIDTSAPDNYSPPDKNASVKYGVDSTLITGWTPPVKTGRVVYNVETKGSASGTHDVNGTAHVTGAAYVSGTALATGRHGNWGNDKPGKTLVGELGQEIVVYTSNSNGHRAGEWETVGNNGAEFYEIPRDAIVFNHIQSKQLLERGFVNGRGSAKLYGTAYANGVNQRVTGGFNWNPSTPSSSTSSSTSAQKASTKSTNKNTDATKKQTKAIDKFRAWLDKFKDWIEVRIQRVQESIDLNTAKSENQVGYQNKNKYLTNAQKDTSTLIKVNQKGETRYLKQAETIRKKAVKTGLVSSKKSKEIVKKIQNGTIDINSYGEKAQEFIKAYTEWYDKAMDCRQAVEELKQSQRELAQQKFDNIVNQYDAMLDHIEHQANMINEYIDQAEAKGYVQSTKYYDALISNEQKTITNMEKERAALVTSLQESMNSGIIKKDSDEWYEMQSQINEVTESILEANGQLIEFNNQIREIQWDKFDKGQDAIKRLVDESEFLIRLMSNDDLFDDGGKLTSEGLATFGLHGVEYNTYMEQANEYKDEMLRINKAIAKDPNNLTLLQRREDLLDLQREAIEAAEDERQAIKSLIEDGIEKELDSLKKLIDKYNDALDSQKDLYDYQKNIKDQTSEIATLQKRLNAYSFNDSEEGKAKRQQLSSQLKEAQENLRESEYDKYISDQKKLLDELYTEYEDTLNKRLDNIDLLISTVIDTVNENSGLIGDTLREQGEAVGYTLTTAMDSLWGAGGSATTVLSTFSQDFSTKATTLQTSVDNILAGVDRLYKAADEKAKQEVKTATTSNASNPQVTSSNNSSSSTGSTSTSAGIAITKAATNGTEKALEVLKQASTTTSTKKGPVSGISATLKNGDKNSNVGKLQKALNALGYRDSSGQKLLVDNWFGPKTQYALQRFQKAMKISQTGKLDAKTKAAFQKKGYASGTRHATEDWARTQEEGPELIMLPDGSVLTPVKGSTIFNAKSTDFLYDFANNPKSVLQDTIGKAYSVDMPAVRGGNTTLNNELNATFVLPNVHNYDEFVARAQHDKKFEKMIQAMTVGQMNGKSSLSKYNIRL